VDPFTVAFPIADGGALDNILRISANTAPNPVPSDYFNAQATTKGLSWLGADFDCVLAFNDATGNIWSTVGAAGGVFFEVTFACGIVAIETRPDPVSDIRTPTDLPNLFSRDETLDGDVLKRWHMRMPILVPPTGPEGPSTFLWATDTLGMAVVHSCLTAEQSCYTVAATGDRCAMHHRIKSRRFLNEEKALYFVVCIDFPYPNDDTFQFALDVLGAQFIRGR